MLLILCCWIVCEISFRNQPEGMLLVLKFAGCKVLLKLSNGL